MRNHLAICALFALSTACVTADPVLPNYGANATLAPATQVSSVAPDEQILFFPSFAVEAPGAAACEAEIQGCVYEKENRSLTLALLHQALERNGFQMTPAQESAFKERVRLFMVDHERGETVVIRIGNDTFPLGKSRADGHFSGKIRMNSKTFHQSTTARDFGGRPIVPFQALLPAGDSRVFSGEILFVAQTGLTVISDIDDTIKITQVTNHTLLLKNTFLEPFQPIPGMSQFYRDWAQNRSAQFWYVSASPWQLFAPLSDFVRSNDFPNGIFCLKNVRWKDRSLLSLFDAPAQYKPKVIEPVLQRFPHRQFILVGDSGEQDPEIYSALLRKYPRQIEKIYIRDITGEPADAPRYRNFPPAKLVVFQSPP